MLQLNQFINKLKIGYSCRSVSIEILLNNGNLKILHFFFKRGWIRHYLIKNKTIIVYLRYVQNKPLFNKIKLISTKGCRRYVSIEGLQYYRRLISRSSLVLLSTSKGLLTLKEAEDLKIGGELFFIFFE